jgi:glycosyl transferase, family 25
MMRTYVINLDRQTARWERIGQLLQGLEFERVSAVEGAGLSGLERRIRDVPRSPEELTRFERACALSHRNVWQHLLTSGASFACVLEDDVFLSPDFPQFVGQEGWIPPDADLVKIEAFSRRKLLLGREAAQYRGRSVRRLLSTNLGTAGYVVSAKGAEKLLAQTEILSRPIDHILFDDLLGDDTYQIYQLSPAICIQEMRLIENPAEAQFISATQRGKQNRLTASEKLTRELKRPLVNSQHLIKQLISWRVNQGKFQKVEFA